MHYVNNYLRDKAIELVDWDEALVPKYNQNSKWSLTTNEDITVRKVLNSVNYFKKMLKKMV